MDFHLSTTVINDLLYRFVELYSGLAISRPETDRLVAALGIAQVFQDILEMRGVLASPFSGVICVVSGAPGYAAAGLLQQDLCHGLLWQQKEQNRVIKISNCGAPTWSWASYMMPVKWHNQQHDTYEACRITRVEIRARFDLACADEPIFSSSSNTGRHEMSIQEFRMLWYETRLLRPRGVLSVTKKALQVLIITGKPKRVLVGRGFPDGHISDEILEAAGHPPFCASALCRYIQGSGTEQYNTGWGSFERMMVEDNPSIPPYQEGDEIYAFHISTSKRVSSGVYYRKFGFSHIVDKVIFLKKIEGMRFERIGVGGLFQQAYFAGVKYREIQLA